MLQVIFKVTLLGLRDQVWHDSPRIKVPHALETGYAQRGARRLLSARLWQEMHSTASFNPWIRKCGFAAAECPRSPNATPTALSRRCRAGERFADNFISKFSEPLDPNPQWRKHRGNVAANLGSLDRASARAPDRERNFQSLAIVPVSQRNAATHHRQFTGTAREKKSRSCSMEKCHSSGL